MRHFAFALIAIVFVSSVAFSAAQPIPGIDIIVKKKPGNVAIHSTSDANGTFLTKPLETGTYMLTFSKGTKAFVSFILQMNTSTVVAVNGTQWDSSKPITVKEGMTITVTILKLGGSIGGTLTYPVQVPHSGQK